MSDLPTTELRPAWSWLCHRCGSEQFANAVVPCSLEGQIPEDMDMGDFEDGEWVTRPEHVRCEDCGAVYAVED